MFSKVKYIIYLLIIIMLFFFQYTINENIGQNLINISSNTINLYDSLSMYNMNYYVDTIQNSDNIDEVKSYLNTSIENQDNNYDDNVNIKFKNTKSLLNLNTTQSEVSAVETYIDENIDFLIEGYTLQIDDKYYYTRNLDDIDWIKAEIYQRITPNEEVAQELITKNEITPYEEAGKTVTDIELDNTISVTQGNVPIEEISETKEDLLYNILHDNEEIKYDTIDSGETIEDVAGSNSISTETLKYNNDNIDDDVLLYDGQELIVNEIAPSINVAYYYSETVAEGVEYSTDIVTDDTMNAGETITEVQGQDGVQNVTYESKVVNGQEQYRNVTESEVVEKPVTEVLRVGTHQVDGGGTGNFIWPSNGKKVICDYYCYSGHGGIDIRDYYGAPIFAADNGTVTYAGCSGPYGCHVFIDHNNGFETRYAHMKQQPSVSAGNNVSQGQVIGYEGATGNVTAEHLHFEIWYNGVSYDPMTYF